MPDEIEVRLKLPHYVSELVRPRKLSEEVRLLVALELYRENVVLLGRAAEIAGIPIREFMYELRRRGIPLNYDLEEFMKDIQMVKEISEKRSSYPI